MTDQDQDSAVSTLICRARDGNEAARSELLNKYRAYLLLMAQRAVGNKLQRRIDQSDIVQQTCTEAWQDMDGFRGSTEPEFSAWVCQILRRNVANVVRDQRAAKRDMNRECEPARDGSASVVWFDAPGKEATASQRVVKGEMALQLANVLDSLPDGQREAVRMRHIEAINNRFIASTAQKRKANPVVGPAASFALRFLQVDLAVFSFFQLVPRRTIC